MELVQPRADEEYLREIDRLCDPTGIGRGELEIRLRSMGARLRRLEVAYADAVKNLTATQERCTTLFLERQATRGAGNYEGANGPAGPSYMPPAEPLPQVFT